MSKLSVSANFTVDGLPDLEVAALITYLNERNAAFNGVNVFLIPDAPIEASLTNSLPAVAAPKPKSKPKAGNTTESLGGAVTLQAPAGEAPPKNDGEFQQQLADESPKNVFNDEAAKSQAKPFAEDAAPADDVLGADAAPEYPPKTSAQVLDLLTAVVKSGPEGNAAVTTFVREELGYKNAKLIPLDQCGMAYALAEKKFATYLKKA